MTAQALERRDPRRRYPILLTLLAQSATDVLDEVVQLFDQAVSARESKAERKMRDAPAERGKAGEDRQALLDDLLDIIFDLGLDDEQIGGLIRGERIGWSRLRSAREQGKPRLPRDHGHLAAAARAAAVTGHVPTTGVGEPRNGRSKRRAFHGGNPGASPISRSPPTSPRPPSPLADAKVAMT
ncbi:hypothetical protein ABT061_46790 [Streptosporangium sp. NPDC002544]|uniref:hypothetical protein n=1 Tax=Streptosporangium sp. NPDC002544 TaxID=3154538 RepID=UPI00331E65AC